MKVLALFPLVLALAGRAAGQCSNIEIKNQWQGNYIGEFTDNAPVNVDGLHLELTFHAPVNSIDYYSGSAEKVDDTHFILTDVNTHASVGDQITFQFQVHFDLMAPLVVAEVLNGKSLCDEPFTTPKPLDDVCKETGITPYDYGQVLCMSFLFYEAERSGKLPADMRVNWRGDSALEDGADVGHDLTGGYYDAGDHVKFGFPMAYTATLLGWGLVDFYEGYQATGQVEHGLAAIKWATDYFIKAHTDTYEFYGQVGSGDLDHAYWGRPEGMTMERPSQKIDKDHGGSDLAGETAAALAAAAIAFQDTDPAYATEMLGHAKELYDFADTYRELYHVSIPGAAGFYQSWSGYGDELCWAALWLARATGEDTYLTKARAHWDEFDYTKDDVAQFSWDDKRAGVYAMFYYLTKEDQYLQALNKYLGWVRDGATYTPEGLVHLDTWGANRHAANVAFLAAKNGVDQDTNRQWAKGQMDQLLGANSRLKRSFVVGYGQNPPVKPHHRSSSCPYPPTDCSGGLMNPGPNPHTLFGALVGGPSQNGDYEDKRDDFIHNEVACDYNAAFTGALAAMVEIS
ncbi:endoglucanase A-like [Portunus trituberculatus]|uniref:endoglucanase A-like n=1 Tax=Portunus trituberculatus TaxID=210409 RepID=UPI001E1D1116|nr:endoglucanase A-like [Portunus trituberculatus]